MRFLPDPQKISKTDASVGTGLAHGFELAGVVLAFFFIGFLLDAWLGTRPIFMLVMSLLGVVGLLARAWFDFNTKMDEIEAARRAPRAAAASDVEVNEHA